MLQIIKNIGAFITDPKNTRMILLAIIVIIVLLFLRQCNLTADAKIEIEKAKSEMIRANNNHEASLDTIKKYNIDGDTWRSEKNIYELTQKELKKQYSDILGKFEYEKNKPPKVIIKTEYVIKEIINNVNVTSTIDSSGNGELTFADSLHHDTLNYRYLTGMIPVKISHDSSKYYLYPKPASFSLEQGIGLNIGLFKDKETKKILLKVDTDYPGITFTNLSGANILDDPKNKRILRQTRKTWGIGINTGYGVLVNPKNGTVGSGIYFGVGLSYSPKFLQW